MPLLPVVVSLNFDTEHQVVKPFVYNVYNIIGKTIENVWSHLKRGIYGVYRHVSKKYLQAYADEYAFRFNHRKSSTTMFDALLSRVSLVRMVTV